MWYSLALLFSDDPPEKDDQTSGAQQDKTDGGTDDPIGSIRPKADDKPTPPIETGLENPEQDEDDGDA